MPDLLIKGNAILPDRVVKDAVVRCRNGRIVEVHDDGGRAAGEPVVDYSGDYIAPGFVDIHVHGGAGADYMDGTVKAVRTINAAHARHGTTSIFPTTTTGSFEQLDGMIRACETVQAGAETDG